MHGSIQISLLPYYTVVEKQYTKGVVCPIVCRQEMPECRTASAGILQYGTNAHFAIPEGNGTSSEEQS